jgi:hypothetical protein
MAGASGKGISEAVRQTIPEWMDTETVNLLTEASPALRGYTLRDSKSWVRKVRRGNETGHTRTYRNNAAPSSVNLDLEVRSNRKDDQIQYFAFRVGGKFITGGDCKVASVFASANSPNQARVTEKAEKKSTVRRLSQAEIDRINVQSEFGDGFDRLFDERD